MAPLSDRVDSELAVDVLVIGAGIQGLYIAREVAKTYSVCVLADPDLATATLESDGFLSAGYDGNDVARIQPARRAAGWWRLWAESNQVAFEPGFTWYGVGLGEVAERTRLWNDAGLVATPADELPPVFSGGSLAHDAAFRTDADLVIDPAVLLTELRRPIEDRFVAGEVVRFGLFTDDAIDDVAVQVGDRLVPIVPRFVVLAAGAGNAELLGKLSARFFDQARRTSSKELVEASQAVRIQYQLCLRGALPPVSGRFGAFTVAAHTTGPGSRRTWVVSAPVDDSLTTTGAANTRFQPPVDPAAVADILRELRAASPDLDKQAADLDWAVYASRRTQHPSLAVADISAVAQPVPAKLEKLGLDRFLAVWPSHLAYAQFVGDSVAERIAEALGAPGQFPDSLDPAALGAPAPPLRARWNRPDFPWQSWDQFRRTWDIV
jgi:hypothetical protein